MTGLSRCGKQYRTFDADAYKLGSDGRYWPAGYLATDDLWAELDAAEAVLRRSWLFADSDDPTCEGGWNDQP